MLIKTGIAHRSSILEVVPMLSRANFVYWSHDGIVIRISFLLYFDYLMAHSLSLKGKDRTVARFSEKSLSFTSKLLAKNRSRRNWLNDNSGGMPSKIWDLKSQAAFFNEQISNLLSKIVSRV